MSSMEKKIALFIDGNDLLNTVRSLGFDVDFKRLLAAIEGRGSLLRAYFYFAITEMSNVTSIHPLLDWLEYNGFTVCTKSIKPSEDREGRWKGKGHMDVEIAIDALNIASYVNDIFLILGNSNFRPLVAALQRRGVRVTIVSSTRTSPSMIGLDLRRQADRFIDFYHLRTSIEQVAQ